MIELARHLEVLLLSNDCVVVPLLGGFVAHTVSARYDEADMTFIPPMRTLGFNAQLNHNDSLLAQSYIEAYDISYPEAIRRIEHDVEEVLNTITSEGFYTFNNIGTLSQNGDNHLTFEPCESGLLSPSLYGLSTFEFKPLGMQCKTLHEETVKDVAIPAKTEETATSLIEVVDTDNDDREADTISIRMSWIRNAVAVAAAVALFFMLSTPIVNSNLDTQAMSSLRNNTLLKLLPSDTNIAKPADKPQAMQEKQQAEAITEKPAVEEKALAEEKAADTAPAEPRIEYCLVLASQVKMKNAEEFVRILQAKGYKDVEIYVHNNVVRVTYGHFNTESEAYMELHNKRLDEPFYEAWVYKRTAEG